MTISICCLDLWTGEGDECVTVWGATNMHRVIRGAWEQGFWLLSDGAELSARHLSPLWVLRVWVTCKFMLRVQRSDTVTAEQRWFQEQLWYWSLITHPTKAWSARSFLFLQEIHVLTVNLQFSSAWRLSRGKTTSPEVQANSFHLL